MGIAVVFVGSLLLVSDGMAAAANFELSSADSPTVVVGLLDGPAFAVAALQKHPMAYFQPWVKKPSSEQRPLEVDQVVGEDSWRQVCHTG